MYQHLQPVSSIICWFLRTGSNALHTRPSLTWNQLSYCLPARPVCAVARRPCLTGSQCLTLLVPCQALFALSDLCVCLCMSCLTGSQCATLYDVCALFITIGSIVLCYCPCAGSLCVCVCGSIVCVHGVLVLVSCLVCCAWCALLCWCACGVLVLLRRTDETRSVRTVRRICHGLPLRVGLLRLCRYIDRLPSVAVSSGFARARARAKD